MSIQIVSQFRKLKKFCAAKKNPESSYLLTGARRGGNMPNRAVGNMVPGVIFLNSNIDPKSTC